MITVCKKDIARGLTDIGLKQGDVVIVHTSLKSIGYVCGGAQAVIEALIETVTSEGTIVMPTQSWKNLDPETGVHWDAEKSDWDKIRGNWPAYDKHLTPTNTMGAVAEMFRQWPGSIRTDHPARSVCAWGKHAKYIAAEHTLSNIFGEGSPIAKLYELDANVLLLGVGYDKNTSIHLADVRAKYPGKHDCIEHSAILENGKRVWKAYKTLFVDGEDFEKIGNAFDKTNLATIGKVCNADARLMSQRDIVDFSVSWIENNRR
ncbi:MAG: aminoglycoside N(3)-acetyltransferase [Treponema sp.]